MSKLKGEQGRDDPSRLDDAARAGWLYYVAGRTQDEIAEILHVSRPTAQRLVATAIEEKLVTFQFNHPIGACMQARAALMARSGLRLCEVVPTDPIDPDVPNGIADRAARLLERHLAPAEPVVIALGTGRALRATVERITPLSRPQHRLVSLVGTIAPDGSATHFDAAGRLADLIGAAHYPMPLPVILPREVKFDRLLERTRELAKAADLSLVGIGNIGLKSPLRIDGFLSADEMHDLMRAGAVGELVGWPFDAAGKPVDIPAQHRLTSVRPVLSGDALVVGVAAGAAKAVAIAAAIRGGLINGLITDESTAVALLKALSGALAA